MTILENIKFEKEFVFTDRDFKFLSELAGERAGINLTMAKRELVYGRLAKRLRKLGFKSFKQYCSFIKDNTDDEVPQFINAITTNVTAFFRENHHFEFLQSSLIPELLEQNKNTPQPRLRIWSAGCSSGKEAYSIAMVIKENIDELRYWNTKILASDLDSNILDIARKGLYPMQSIEEITVSRKKWFRSGVGENKGVIKISDELRDLVSFKQLNLTAEWPMRGLFDFIFYRNVAIYFDKETRKQILDKMADKLKIGGCLFVGHSESLYGLTDRFEPVGRTIHRKKF